MNQFIYDVCLQYNIPIWIFLITTGVIFGIVGILSNYIDLKNTLIKTRFMVEYEQIKLKHPNDPTAQVDEILPLYKQNGYKHGLSIILKIATIILNMFIFISLMSIWQSSQINYSLLDCSFLWMNSIFNKTSLIYLSLIIATLSFIADIIGKNLKNSDKLKLLSSVIISFLIMMLYGLLFSTTYLMFLIGTCIVKITFSIFTINIKKEIVKQATENTEKLKALGLTDTSSESKKQAFNIIKNEINDFVEGDKKAKD